MTTRSTSGVEAPQPVSGSTLERSTELYQSALRHLPGGNTRSTFFVAPHPPYAASGAGHLVFDVDGNELIDLQNNYTALIHGHANPGVERAAISALSAGVSFGLPTSNEIALASELGSRIGWATKWRFANSGTEAVMMAIRLARVATGRSMVLRFDDCYHGTYDGSLQPGAPGVPSAVAGQVISVRGGDWTATESALSAHGEGLACVLFDAMPNRAGLRPAGTGFVTRLREETARRGIVLIQDEVLTFRLAVGGLHSLYGYQPDLITVGKVIGGGFPVGAVGGNDSLMGIFDPRSSNPVPYGGTFSANPVTMAAGLAALEQLDDGEIERLNALGDWLRGELSRQGWDVTGQGSLLRLHVPDAERLWWEAFERGLLVAANGLLCLSTPMQGEIVADVARRFAEVRGETGAEWAS